MEFSLLLGKQVLIMFLLLLTGMIVYWCRLIRDDGVKQLTDLLLYVVAPLLILMSYQMDYDEKIARNMLFGFLLSAGSIVLSIFISKIMKIKGKAETIPTERFAVIFTNCGFMGIPLVSAVFGSIGIVYCTTYLTMFNLFVWTYGLVLMKGKPDKPQSWKERLKPFCTPTMFCIVLGIGLYFLKLRLPSLVNVAISHISSMNTPLAMIVAGIYIARSGLLHGLKNVRLYAGVAVKCILIPFAVLLVFCFLPLDNELRMTILIASACPTATNSMLFAGKFGGDEKAASHLFALTTLLSVVTMPAVVYVATFLF